MSAATLDLTDTPTGSESPPAWFRAALRALVLLPIAVAVIRALATGWFPVGDSALLAIRASDVGTGHHPLLGSWTSASLTLGVDVNNPGPLYADLLAPFTWTLGRWLGIGPAIALGVGSINAAFALLSARVGNAIGGWRLERFVLVMVAALTWSMGSELLIDIWQPHALLVPFACLLLLTTGVLVEVWKLLPTWLAVASLVIQTHLGYVYVVVVLGAMVGLTGVRALRAMLRDDDRSLREYVVHPVSRWSVGVLIVAWIQPVIEQLAGEGRGNLARLAANASGGDVTIGAGTAVKLVANVVALPPWWTRWGFEDSVRSTPLTDSPDGPVLLVPGLPSGPAAVIAVGLVLLALAAMWQATRRFGLRVPNAALLVCIVLVATAVATLTIQTVSIVGLGSHHVRWLWVVALFVQMSALYAVVESGWLAAPAKVPDGATAAVVGVLVVSNLGVTAHDLGPTADRAAADTLERTFDDLATVDPGGPVRYDVSNLRPFEPWSSAVQMRFRELGVDFRVDDEGVVRQLGNGRRADGSEVTTVRQIERGAAVRYTGPGCVLSSASPFDTATEARVDAFIDAAVSDLTGGAVMLDLDGLDPDLEGRFEAAAAGDVDEAFVLVADGLLPFLAAEGRIDVSSEAIDAAVANAALIDRRVVGTLVLVADPPVGCPG